MIERSGELDAAARHIGVLWCCGELGARRNFVRGFSYHHAVGMHEAGGDGRLRLGAAVEQAALDEQAIGAHARAHAGLDVTRAGSFV
jgi:hypothetical protein